MRTKKTNPRAEGERLSKTGRGSSLCVFYVQENILKDYKATRQKIQGYIRQNNEISINKRCLYRRQYNNTIRPVSFPSTYHFYQPKTEKMKGTHFRN